MIKIQPYQEHPQGNVILDRYLYMVAYVLPFSPEDILGVDELKVDGNLYNAKNFILKSRKNPRRRNINYNNLLSAFGIQNTAVSSCDKFEQDQLLAARLIWHASKELYAYLYQSSNPQAMPNTLPPVRRDNLRKLLLSKMDELDPALEKIGIINNNYSAHMLYEVFRYHSFIAIKDNHKVDHVKRLLDAVGVNVCPYCNRLYTVTLANKGGTSRAQLDHYRNKDQYPYFAVSLMNLIPSCGLCNQSKGKNDVAVLYPYSDEMGLDAVFQTKIKNGISYLTGNRDAIDEFSVVLDIAEGLPKELVEKIEYSDRFFNLTELYNQHKDYILYLFWKNYVFSNEYLDELCRQFPEAFCSFEDAKAMMYLMDIEQAQWGKRSLGKLTHDIDMEINGET